MAIELPQSRAPWGWGQRLIHLYVNSIRDSTQFTAVSWLSAEVFFKLEWVSWVFSSTIPLSGKKELKNMTWGRFTYPSFLAQSKLGPNTIAMLLGVILLTSLVWASFARNLIKYLWNKREGARDVLWNVYRNQSLAQVQHFTHFFGFFGGTGVWIWGFMLAKHTLLLESHLKFILLWLFWRWVWKTICLGWPQTTILPTSASQVARITGVSHWSPAYSFLMYFLSGNTLMRIWKEKFHLYLLYIANLLPLYSLYILHINYIVINSGSIYF
jgi:hypothetical protein